MNVRLLVGDVPFAVPFASSHDCHGPLWNGGFWRLTPGALSLQLCVLLSLAGGRA